MNYNREKVDRAKANALTERFYNCWSSKDLGGMSECLEQEADNHYRSGLDEMHFHGTSEIVSHRLSLLSLGSLPLTIEKMVCSESGREVAVFWRYSANVAGHRLRGAEWLAMNSSVTAISSITSDINLNITGRQ